MPPKEGATGSRLVTIGSTPPREYSLDKPLIAIGSHPKNDIVLDDTSVSRRHATITRKPDGFELEDLGSTNGTFVNGRQLRKPITLTSGDEIKFGSVRVGFDPSSVPRRMRRGFVIMTVMFLLGFMGSRFRNQIGPTASEFVAWISSRQPAAAPSAINPKPLVANAEATTNSTPSSAIPARVAPAWLTRVNYYRTMAKLPPIVEDPALSKGDRAHTIYMVKTYHDSIATGGGLGAEMHNEDPGNPNFTPEGLEAAKSSDMDEWSMRGRSGDEWGSPAWSIDGWMALPFHRMPILNPALTSAGFGIDCEADACSAGLDLLKGAQGKVAPGLAGMPIEFPPDGTTVAFNSFENEWPDPRTSCPGYAPPSGLTITLQLGSWMDTHLDQYSVARVNAGGSRTPVEACGFSSTSYSNPDAYSQELGRNVLKSYGTVVVIPRAPLDKGASYAVSMTANGKRYDWTFSISP